MIDRVYGLASGLVGFRVDSLRVRILRAEESRVWVITADLLDAGTRLVLDVSQVIPEADCHGPGLVRHKDGLVLLG